MTPTETILAEGLQKLANMRQSYYVTTDEFRIVELVEKLAKETLAAAGIELRRPDGSEGGDTK